MVARVALTLSEGAERASGAGDGHCVAVPCHPATHALEQPEEAIVLGAHRGMLWYRADHHSGNEGSGVHEGASLPW